MPTITSADGTTIAYDAIGDGPPLILVPAVLSTRAGDPHHAALQQALAGSHTVVFYDRRGRGESTNTAPYAPERELEDIAALIDAVGGSAALFGSSSGGVIAIHAARALDGVTRLAVFEPPLIVDDSRPPIPADYVEHLDALIAEGRRGEAVEYLMTAAIGIPAEYLEPMKQDPSWQAFEAVADTISHDGRFAAPTMAGKPLPAEWAEIEVPTLVVTGELSQPFLHDGNRALAELLPDARHETLPGQQHAFDPAVLAPVLDRFLRS